MAESESISTLAEALVSELIDAGCSAACAESCTGGWIAKSITDVAGSSSCFGYGIVSYSNGAKETMLGVSQATLEAHGAVSEPAVREMVEGVLRLSGADFAVSVSGIAGPDGGSEQKPVGTVWLAWAEKKNNKMNVITSGKKFDGDRDAVRAHTVVAALQGLRERVRTRG